MNWFEEQIKLRKKNDDKDLADAMEDIASSVLHKQNTSFYTDRKKIKNALDEILLVAFHICREQAGRSHKPFVGTNKRFKADAAGFKLAEKRCVMLAPILHRKRISL